MMCLCVCVRARAPVGLRKLMFIEWLFHAAFNDKRTHFEY